MIQGFSGGRGQGRVWSVFQGVLVKHLFICLGELMAGPKHSCSVHWVFSLQPQHQLVLFGDLDMGVSCNWRSATDGSDKDVEVTSLRQYFRLCCVHMWSDILWVPTVLHHRGLSNFLLLFIRPRILRRKNIWGQNRKNMLFLIAPTENWVVYAKLSLKNVKKVDQ